MIQVQPLFAFALVAALLTIVPGIDTSLVLRGALTRGHRYGFATAIGICCGALVWGVAAAIGASALLAASELAYRVLTLAGAGYMIWLGGSLIWKSFRRGADAAAHDLPAMRTADSLGRAWLTGFGTNLLNPKVGVFYLATIPQFIPAGTSPALMGVALAAVHALLSIIWFAAIILATAVVSRWLRSPRAVRIIDRITGTVLVGFGGKLAAFPH